MKKYLALGLLSSLLLTSCSVDWNDAKEKRIGELEKQLTETRKEPIISTENPQKPSVTNTEITSKDFGSGFILSQTNQETTLSYSGGVIKTWSHVPPKVVPFVWDEACATLWEKFDKLPPNNRSSGKQGAWENLGKTEQELCMKEFFRTNGIDINSINNRFYQINQRQYETYDSWIFDTKSRNLQSTTGKQVKNITETTSGVVLMISPLYGDDPDSQIIFDTNFKNVLSN